MYIPFDLIESRFREKDLTGVQAMKQRQRDLIRQEAENRTQAEIDLAGHISAVAGASGGQKSHPLRILGQTGKRSRKGFIRTLERKWR